MNTFYYKLAHLVTALLRKEKCGKIYLEALNSLGEDVSPIYNELGCAESVSTVLQRADASFVGCKGIVSTAVFDKYFRNSPLFERVYDNKPGDILVYPTGTNTGSMKHGHIFIVGLNGQLMSNNSSNSLLEENYTIDSAKAYYEYLGGFKPRFYRAK